MTELKGIYLEDVTWRDYQFQMVKELCSSTVAKDGLTKIQGEYLKVIIDTADMILEKLYPGDDLLTAKKANKIRKIFDSTDGRLGTFEFKINSDDTVGAFDFESSIGARFHDATQIEIEDFSWDTVSVSGQLTLLKTELLDKSSSLPKCSSAFLLLSYVENDELCSDILKYLKESAPAGADCRVIVEREGCKRTACLLTIS